MAYRPPASPTHEQHSTAGPSSSQQHSSSSALATALAGDLISAMCASFTVSPVVSTMDRAIAKNAAGTMGLWPALGEGLMELLRKPISGTCSLPTRWLMLVYTATFFGANSGGTLSEYLGINAMLPVLFGSTAGNMSPGIMKDAAFAKMYGATAPRPMPRSVYAMFVTRDVLAMAFVFNLPTLISPIIKERSGLNEKRATLACQLSTPVISQVFSTPLHLLGFIKYNQPDAGAGKLLRELGEKYPSVVSLRMLRIIPAFSVGGVVNREMRQEWRAA